MANPTVTDENFDTLYDSGKIPLTAETPTADTEEAFDARYDRDHPTTPPGVVKPETPIGQPSKSEHKSEEPKTLTGYLSETVEPFYNFLAEEHKIGMAGVHEGEEGFAAQRGAQSYEDAEAHLATDKAQVINSQKKIEAFRDASAAYKAFSFVEPAAQMMPILEHLAGVYGVGFAAGVPIGAAAGVALGVETGPGAALTGAAGALANGALGGDAAVFTATSALMGGNKYMQLRREGHSQEDASNWSTALGLVQGAIGSLRLGQIAGAFKNRVIDAASPLFTNALGQYAKTVGTQAGLGALNETANLITDAALALTSGKKGEMPTGTEIASRLSKAVADSAVQALALQTGVEGAKAVWQIPKTVPQTLRVIKQMAQNPDKNLAELPAPVAPPKPIAEPELVREEPKVETRSKGEIARDEERTLLHGKVQEVVRDRIKAEEIYKAAQEKVNNLKREGSKEALQEARTKRDYVQEEFRFAKESEDLIKQKQEETEANHHAAELTRVNRAAAKTVSPKSGGVPNSRMERGTDVQDVLNRIRKYVQDQSAADKAISEYQQAELDNKVTPAQQMEYEAAKYVRGLKDKTSTELRSIANEIKLVYGEGKTGRLKQLADKAEKRHQLLIQWREAAQGKHAVESDVNPPSKPKVDYSKGTLAPGALNFFGNYLSKPKFILHEAVNRDELIKEIGVRDILTTVDKQVMDNDKMLMGHLTEATGKTPAQVNELIRLGAKKKISITVYTGGKEGITELPKQSEITINQAMDKLLQLDDPEAARALIEGNKFQEESFGASSTKQELIDKLSAEDPAYAKMPKAYNAAYKELFPRLAKEYKNTTGEDLPNNPHYSGTIRHEKNNTPGQQEFEAQLQSRRTAYKTGTASKPTTTKSRTGDQSPLAYEDIHQKFQRNSRQTEHWIGFNEPSREILGPVLRDPELGRIVDRKYGTALMKSWREDLSDIIYGNSDKKTAWNDFINEHLLKNTSIFMLAGKPIMFLKHWLSVVTAARDLPVAALVKGVAKFYTNPIKNAKSVMSSKEYITRHGKEDLNTAATAKMPEQMKHPIFNTIDHWAMSPTIYGIKMTDAAILYTAREHYMGKGMSEAEALAKGGDILHNTQVSAAIDMTSSLSRSSIGKLVTMFQGQVTNLATETYIAWDRAMVMPSVSNIAYAVKASAISGMSLAIFEGINATYKYAMAADDKGRDQALYEGTTGIGLGLVPIINYPLVKDFTKIALASTINAFGDEHFKVPEMDTLVGSFAENTTKAYQDILHASTDEDWASEHALQIIIDVHNVIGWKVGSPFKSTLDFFHRLEKLNQ